MLKLIVCSLLVHLAFVTMRCEKLAGFIKEKYGKQNFFLYYSLSSMIQFLTILLILLVAIYETVSDLYFFDSTKERSTVTYTRFYKYPR